MENPATWGPAEETVNRVLNDFYEERQKTPDDRLCGFSLAKQITVALSLAGLLKEEGK